MGLGLDYVKGWGSILNFVTQQDARGKYRERKNQLKYESRADVELRPECHTIFPGERKLGIYYSYGFVSADFGNVSHTLNGQPQSLDTTQSAGRSSEVGIRFRGVLTRKLFYGAQASWFLLSSG